MNIIPYGRHSIDEQDVREVTKALKSAWLTQGPKVVQFEEALARTTGAPYAAAVSNGTAALHLAMMAIGLKPGDEIITSPITFAASANCALYAGAMARFVDIDDATYHMDLNRLKDFLKSPVRRKKIKAVVPVHFMGTVMDMRALQTICAPYGIKVIEDAAHALGAKYLDGKTWIPVGSCRHSDATIFSFHPIKHITTAEGGAVMTRDRSLYDAVRRFRHHGIVKNFPASGYLKPFHKEGWFYDIPQLGLNYRLTDLQSALGTSQLKKLNVFVKRRWALVDVYNEAFRNISQIRTPFEREGSQGSYHLYPIRVPAQERNHLYDHLKKNGITAQVNYIPVHLLSCYQKLGYKFGDFPVAEKYFSQCLSLPLFPALSFRDQGRVIKTVKQFFGKN